MTNRTGLANSSVATRRPDLGIFEDVQYLTGQSLTTRLDRYAALGIRYMRFQLEWSNVQAWGADGGYAWQPDDAVVQGLLARGIEPVVVIDDTPGWARSADCQDSPSCAPADPRQFARFAAAAVIHYREMGVHYWEIWNEPNNPTFWRPHPDVAAYAALLRDSYVAMKAVDPSAVILTGGTAPAATTTTDTGVPIWISPVDFLAGIYAHGGKGHFDGVAVHPYVYPALPGDPNPGSAWYQMYGTPTSIRSLMVNHGDGDKLIWGTEFGAPTDLYAPGHGPVASQSETLAEGYRLWRSYPWTGPLIWFLYRDTGIDTADPGTGFGLLNTSGTRKPSYFTFRALTAEQP